MIFNTFKFTFAVWLMLFFFSVNVAQAAKQKHAFKNITLAEVQQRIQSIKNKQNLSDELKALILTAYQESEDNLRELANQESQVGSFKRLTTHFPEESKALAVQIQAAENNLKNLKSEALSALSTEALEQRKISEKTRLSDLDAEIVQNQNRVNELTRSPQKIREKIAEIKAKQLTTQQDQENLARKNGENLYVLEAQKIQLDTRLRLLNTSLKALELESISSPMQLELQNDRSQWLNLQREHQVLMIAELDNYLIDRHQQEADKEHAALLLAEKEAEGKHPLIREATADNMNYSRKLQDVNKNIEQYTAEKNAIDTRFKQLEKDFQSAEKKINLAGLSPALGNLLREQRRNLPQRKQYKDTLDAIQNEIAAASLESYKLEEVQNNLLDLSQALSARLEQDLPPNMNADEVMGIRTELRMLLNEQKDLVGRLSTAYSEYAQMLGDVDFTLQQMLNSAEKFSDYLDRHLLWVPSAPVISQAYLSNILQSAIWFVSPSNWLKVGDNLWQGFLTYPGYFLALIVVFVALRLRFKTILKNHLATLLSKSTAKLYLVSFSQTLGALAILLLLSLPVPLLMAWLAGVIKLTHNAASFSRAFASGLLLAAVSLCLLQFFYRLFKPNGVAELLFHWSKNTVQILYSQIKWARFIIIPCVFIIGMANVNIFSVHSNALGRTAQILLMLTMSYMMHRFAHPLTGLAKDRYQFSDDWISKLRYVWYLLAVLAPWVVIGFSVAGYYQSALELQGKLITTLRLVFFTALIHALTLRWLNVTKRQLALQNARQKRKQAIEQANLNAGAEGNYLPEETLLDISKINQQSDKLLNTLIVLMLAVGTWMVWRDIVPAFSIFDQVELWQYSEIQEGKEVLMPVTLINLFISIFYAGLAFVFVSNFPTLVDLMSVGKFSLTAGSRYALIQLSRYVLVSVAFLAIANELGGSWAKVQWLVAALSVGLGFGLQEIFANMVSGVILLFERPIRVGDTVTVGDVTGRVCRIQMRATHILDWDLKELVVPNKTIITDRLVNWTLSDTVTRVVLMLGVAYGSDVELVEKVLKDVVCAEEMVLRDPEPMISFLSFGESSLDFRVCVFVRELGDRMAITHILHKKFYKALQANNIEIPFPQRDLHLRSVADGIMPA